MRHLSRALVQSLGWLQNAKELSGTVMAPFSLVTTGLLTLAQEDPSMIRRLFLTTEEDGGENDRGLMMSPGLLEMDDDAFPQFMIDVNECGLDVDEMVTTMFTMAGQLGVTDGEGNVEDMPVLDPNSFFVGTQDEPTCSIAQEKQMTKAAQSFVKCTGWEALFANDVEVSGDLEANFMEKCTNNPALDPIAIAMNPPENPLDMADLLKDCLDFIFGDNVLGDFLRDLYHNPDKNCKCVNALGQSFPSCAIEVGSSSAIKAIKKVSGTATKSSTCILGLACDMFEDACTAELTGLDQCLPLLMDETDLENGESSYECNNVNDACVERSVVSMMLPSELTRGALPDSCVRVSQENQEFQTRHVMARFDQYIDKCDKSSPLTVPIHTPTTTKNAAVTNAQTPSSAAMEDEKIYKVVSTAATNESQENSSSPLAILALGLFVGGMIAFVAARHQYKKYMYTEIAPRNNFQMVSHEDNEESMFSSGVV